MSRRDRSAALLLAGAALAASSALAQESAGEATDIADMSLESLLDMETSVATRTKGTTVREAPGIVTVLTREEILRSGARDLLDVLRLVPSLQFGVDVYNVIYAAIRGQWGANGKILVLLDGHAMSDLLYFGAPLANRIPVDWIERVEIIRGPGSVMYGGSAELAVINVVTRSAAEIHGVGVTGHYSQMLDGVANHGQSLGDTYGMRYLSLSTGGVAPGGELSAVVNVFAGEGNVSDRDYTDIYGSTYNMAGNGAADPLTASLRLGYKGLDLGVLLERYSTTMRDGYGENLKAPLRDNFYTSSVSAAYTFDPGKGFKLTPRVGWTYQRPWVITDPSALQYPDPYYWDPSIHRVTAGLEATWDATSWLNLTIGGEYTYDHAEDDFFGFEPDLCFNPGERLGTDPSCKTVFDLHNGAVYGQGLVVTDFVDISAGARFEDNSRFGTSFVPRGALTKAFGPFHYKALAAQAFMAPSTLTAGYSPDVKPEKTTIFELELGYRLTDFLFVVANGFYSMIDGPIVYFYDSTTNDEGYKNYSKTGTAGMEAELRFKLGAHFANLGYAYYNPAGQNKIETWAVPGHDNVLLGFAQHKVALNGGVQIVDNLTFNVSTSLLLGDRYGYTRIDENDEMVLKKFDPEVTVNANFMYRNLFADGVFVQVGARNLTNGEIWYIQPYNNGHAPIPGPSAEVFLKAGYETP
ncbi:MAG: TonB-dependent receptor plug domain-containing protein [Deltaproteobacteria bacterium]|nr:TonB-dependent receptor plug domain-containing protein [Deltaproteobacteria bacterium]